MSNASPTSRRRDTVTTTTKKPSRDRLSDIGDRTLRADSLVGSFFHSDVGRSWQGCVVAEPNPGVYLVELFDWMIGASSEQRLVPITEMTDWSFYDNAEWMNNAYEHGKQRRWEHEREHDQQDE